MRHLSIALAVIAALLGGCANLTTVGRSSTLPAGPHGAAKAVHLDAKQRVVYSNALGKLCAEPSPDALSAYAASASGSLAAEGYGSAALAAALAESSGSIGLRTQSITLMRDHLYRICELFYSGGLNPIAAHQLVAKSQALTLGVLAIEQLTGAVVAQQVALGGSSNGNSMAGVTDAVEQLKSARRFEQDAQKKVSQTEAELAKINEQLTPLAAELATHQQTLAANPSDETAKQKVAELEPQVNDLTEQKKLKEAEMADDKKVLAEATKIRQELEKTVNTTLATAAAGATSSARFGAAQGGSRIDAVTAVTISDNVYKIVDRVLNDDSLLAACTAAMTSQAQRDIGAREALAAKAAGGDTVAEAEVNLLTMCNQYIKKQIEANQ